jgi:Mn2+/Fe2+ NRAMP family transporter
MAESKGLPMTAKWDPEKLQRDTAELEALAQKPFLPRAAGYIKRTGPGLLQSAMTLGAGSATASVLAGASFGYKLLWVQPVAMFLGVMMLAALGNIVLSTGERPYKSFGRESSKILVFLWALGTIMASIIWHFPQYGLAAGAARDLASMAGVTVANTGAGGFTPAGYVVSFLIGGVILSINIFAVFSYGSSARGIKLYEWFLRSVIAMIVLMFAIVVVASAGRIQWLEVGKGFIGWYGIPGYQNTENVTLVLGMLGAAVGINMTFLYPYSLLAKGWGKSHKALSRWDLGMSMFLPFTLVTSLVIMAMAVTIHDGTDAVRAGLQPVAAAASLSGVLGENAGRIVFNLGLIAMTCTAISTHMVVCGFTFCEMFGLEYTKTRFRFFAMVPSVGLLGVVTTLPFWFPVAASAICFTMLPIAYLLFLILNNKASFLGDGMIKSPNREVFNFILVIALAVSVIGAGIQINSRVIKNPQVRALFGAEAPAEPVKPPAPTAPLAPTVTPGQDDSAEITEAKPETEENAPSEPQEKPEPKPDEKADAPAEKKE